MDLQVALERVDHGRVPAAPAVPGRVSAGERAGDTVVYVFCTDPLSQAGMAAYLTGCTGMRLVGESDLDRANVALVVTESVDDQAVRILRALRREGGPRLLLVAAAVTPAGALAATRAGATGLLRRSAVTRQRLVAAVRAAATGQSVLPEDLMDALAEDMQRHAQVAGHAQAAAGPGAGAPVTGLRALPPAGPVAPGAAPSQGAAQGTAATGAGAGASGAGALAAGTQGAGTPGAGVGVAGGSRFPVQPPRGGLSSRDLTVLRLLGEGCDTREIARHMSYSERTVKNVIQDLTRRFGLRNRSHAVAFALRNGLI
jgi:DNA-binding NarL/FixJ family response regulator